MKLRDTKSHVETVLLAVHECTLALEDRDGVFLCSRWHILENLLNFHPETSHPKLPALSRSGTWTVSLPLQSLLPLSPHLRHYKLLERRGFPTTQLQINPYRVYTELPVLKV
jgi:hypothetical protein